MAYKSKAELIEEAQGLGLDVSDDMTRDEIIDEIEAAGGPDEDRAEEDETAEAEPGGNLGFPHQPGMAP